MAGVESAAVNEYLLAAEPTAPSGSSWELRPVADYDFTEIILAAILMEFADDPDTLWPQTQNHLVDTLLIETGYRIRWTVPGSLGVVQETENHILMTEVSRYLRNLWLSENRDPGTRHERRTERHAREVASFMDELESSGLYEFNSQPYGGYTMAAALVAYAYAEQPELKHAARRLLDRQAVQFALGSNELRRVVPFRRQLSRADRTYLYEDPMSAIAAIWKGAQPGLETASDLQNGHHAVIAALTGYRPGPMVYAELAGALQEQLVFIGHGPDASPEIHSSGPQYHLSAGGVGRGRLSGIAARPTVLLLDDGVTDISQLFRIPGSGSRTSWNNTGVAHRFAVGPEPVAVPEAAEPIRANGVFELYVRGGVGVIVVRDQEVGVIYLPPGDPSLAFERVVAENDPGALHERFAGSDGTEYNYALDAPVGEWVMRDGAPGSGSVRYDEWPRLSIEEFR
jgi:hypothetical protein